MGACEWVNGSRAHRATIDMPMWLVTRERDKHRPIHNRRNSDGNLLLPSVKRRYRRRDGG
jgi:hypothetical protein